MKEVMLSTKASERETREIISDLRVEFDTIQRCRHPYVLRMDWFEADADAYECNIVME